MSLEHHHDLAREFPELKHESPEFRQLFEYDQPLANEILRIEQEIETPSDAYTEQLKHRARLKDHLYGLLTGRRTVHPARCGAHRAEHFCGGGAVVVWA